MAKRYKFGKDTAFASAGGYTIDLISAKLPEVSTEEIEDTVISDDVMKTVDSGYRQVGDMVFTVPWEPDNQPTIGGDDEVYTITLPKHGSDLLANALTVTGHVTSVSNPTLETGTGRQTQDVTLKANSLLVFVENN